EQRAVRGSDRAGGRVQRKAHHVIEPSLVGLGWSGVHNHTFYAKSLATECLVHKASRPVSRATLPGVQLPGTHVASAQVNLVRDPLLSRAHGRRTKMSSKVWFITGVSRGF